MPRLLLRRSPKLWKGFSIKPKKYRSQGNSWPTNLRQSPRRRKSLSRNSAQYKRRLLNNNHQKHRVFRLWLPSRLNYKGKERKGNRVYYGIKGWGGCSQFLVQPSLSLRLNLNSLVCILSTAISPLVQAVQNRLFLQWRYWPGHLKHFNQVWHEDTHFNFLISHFQFKF